ncbi:Signal transduction histidine kinase [Dyadobacter sp. SG02]|uniref:hybrid sensor histidine kinase/response regulator transcription factor n=1 Tax=Dyadobacter sp. SG02 TaxID=1855291 RepID=UPI0008B1BD77|nr:hybrid sensor histidine kinase/response regulator transcription factor [Dyadobacter sp. SG02]SEI59684.1 Signal transduction histidine kinase [Dyadobacter sp. SG02]
MIRPLVVLLLCGLAVCRGVPGRLYAQSTGFPVPETITARQGLPQGFVPGIVQDSRGFMWLATRDGLCRYDGRSFRVFQPSDAAEASLSSLGLENLQTTASGQIWITSDQGQIDLFDPVRETFVNFSRQAFYQQQFGKRFLRDMYADRQRRLWLMSDGGGLDYIHLDTRKMRSFHRSAGDTSGIAEAHVRLVSEDREGRIWAVTNNGLFVQKKGTDAFVKYRSATLSGGIDERVNALKGLKDGRLLLLYDTGMALLDPATGTGPLRTLVRDTEAQYRHPIVTDSKGSVYFFRMNRLYRLGTDGSLTEFPVQPDVHEFKSLFIDRSDVLWAGTNGQGIRKYNLRASYFITKPYSSDFIPDLLQYFLKVPQSEIAGLPADLFSYNFRYAFESPQKMWFAAGRTPLYTLDLATRRIQTIPFPVEIKDIKRSELAISLAKDPDGRMWAMYDSLLYSYRSGAWTRFPHAIRPRIESGIYQIVADRQFIWVATTMRGLYRIDKATGGVRRYGYNAPAGSLSSDNLYCLYADPLDENLLWIGTFGGGLCKFDKRTGHCERLSRQNGLPNNVVYAAIPDLRGNVWVATNQGLSQVDRNTLRTRTYTREDGLMADEFNRFHALALPDGRIFLGGMEGITAFDSKQPNEDTYRPPVYITGISINNAPLDPRLSAGEPPVAVMQSLDLAHWQNFLTIEFAAMQYNRSDKIRYRYQLEGVDENWIETETPVTKYTDLRPGHYVLRLNASNTLGVWSTQVRALQIRVSPPWWQTWWAYGLYFLVFLGVIYGLLRVYINRVRMQQSILFKQKEIDLKAREAGQLRELDEMKTRFFSNITHEFRTPLTLILGPAGQMLEEPREQKDNKRLSLIDRNARQLLGLINQLLDLSKLEAGTTQVDAAWGDLVDFVEMLTGSFQMAAEAKNVELEFQNSLESRYYWFDHEKLERIVTNLLSNAVKFANDGGRILVTLHASTDGTEIAVANTGARIPDAQLGRIFDRFYQADRPTGYHEGTGIGLAIVKELVGLQGGTVSVKSGVDGFDTVFKVALPYRRGEVGHVPEHAAPKINGNGQGSYGEALLPKILLVEDNAGLAEFVSDSLAETYRFYHARNGEEGLTMAAEIMPDLIISDVMMPVMDGYVFCKYIKSNLETSHIPVVLLTAKSALESRVEGLELGADDYITKPFHLPELRLRIRNLLDRQTRLYEHLRAVFATPAALPADQEVVTDPFLNRLHGILDTRLDDPDFGVTELIREIGMSNSSLNRKLKTLTDLSAVELIRNYRLKKAAALLSDGVAVSEAAYAVGFDNLSYFAKCFRDLYNMTPREFAANGIL